jgi:HK97 family phage portal protein
MNILKRLFGRSNNDEQRLMIQGPNWQPSDYLPPTIGIFNSGGRSDAGIPVDEVTALTCSAVFSAVDCIANSIATLPLHVVKRNQQEQAIAHPIYSLLHDSPNDYMTSVTFRQCMMYNLLLWGHCNAFIEKDETGTPIALYPLRSAVTRPIRMFGQLLILTQVGTTMTYLTPDQVFSVVHATLDGITPISPITQARQTIGLSLALEKFAAKFFGNGTNTSGILTLPPGMNDDAVRNFVASWKKQYGGTDNAFRVGMLPPDYKFQQTGTDPEKAQALQSRVNQLREVARVYHVPPSKLGDNEHSHYANLEGEARAYVIDCLQPHCVKWEQEANRKLLLEKEKPDLEVKFDLDGLLRADTVARFQSYATGITNGIYTRNECRIREGLPPIPGLDAILMPLNMAPASGPTAPKATPDDPDDDPADSDSRALVEDAARRLLTKEAKALARAVKKHLGKPDELRKWAGEWYAAHEPLVIRVLTPTLKAAKAAGTPEAYAKEHCQESIRAIAALVDGGADDLIDEWETIRPAEIADALTKKAA